MDVSKMASLVSGRIRYRPSSIYVVAMAVSNYHSRFSGLTENGQAVSKTDSETKAILTAVIRDLAPLSGSEVC